MKAIPIDDFLADADERPSPLVGARTDWPHLVAEARAARKASDGGFWRIGAIASTVERRYRGGALKRFAEDIGMSLGSVRRLRWVAESYDERARKRFPTLSFSHFQAVAGLEDRIAWLDRAQHGGWSVDRVTTESRMSGAREDAQARLRRPIDTASRSLARLVEQIETQRLTKATRAHLADAADELAEQVEALRTRLRAGGVRRLARRAR